jgi:DNA invertase Pin-like site-specific DNA recombinase
MKTVGIYCRVSTQDQSTIQQLEVLREYCKKAGYEVIDEYIDEGISALSSKRPQFLRILDDARKRRINLILVYKICRFSRSVKELLNTMDLLKDYNVDFMSYMDKSMDTTTSSGRFMFQIMAAVSELERAIISERTKLKLQHLKSKGAHLGRPVKARMSAVYELRQKGLSLSQIGRELGCHRSSCSKALKRHSRLEGDLVLRRRARGEITPILKEVETPINA